jgi:hypothetical protein
LIVAAVTIRLVQKGTFSELLRTSGLLALALTLAFSAMVSVSWMTFGQFKLARNSNVFLLAKLLEEGPARSYLAAACETRQYSLCRYRNELDGLTNDDLKWGFESPFQKVGGFDKLEPEAAEIVAGTLRQYPLAVLRRAVADTGRQLLKFSIGEGLTPQTIELVASPIGAVFGPDVEAELRQSKQAAGSLPIAKFNLLQAGGLGLSLAIIVLVLVSLRALVPATILCLLAFLAASFVWNAVVTGGLSGPYDRYFARIVWLLVFAGGIVVLHMWRRRAAVMQLISVYAHPATGRHSTETRGH